MKRSALEQPLALMGADSVRARSAGLADLENIGDALDAAQRLIVRAESLAVRLSEPRYRVPRG